MLEVGGSKPSPPTKGQTGWCCRCECSRFRHNRWRLARSSSGLGRRPFYHTAIDPQGWEAVRVPASDCPRLSPAFLEEERRTMGDYIYSQEYDLAFVDDETSIFSEDSVARAFD